MLPFARFTLLVTSGVLAGATVAVWLLEHSFAGSAAFFTEFKQLEIQSFTVPLPAVGLIAVVFGLAYAALVRQDRGALALTLAGVVCLGIGAVITARGHFPMNDRIATWSPSSPPAEWTDVQDRWRRTHDVRTGVTVLGFGLFVLGTSGVAGRPGRSP